MRVPQRVRRSPSLSMTPMIDVVFQLIIFFLLSTHFAQQETHLELDLPEAASGREIDDAVRRVTVNVLRNGTVLLGNNETPQSELASRLKFEQDKSTSGLEVRIRGDRDVPYAVVEPILLACADAGIWNVTFSVYKRAQRGVPSAEVQE